MLTKLAAAPQAVVANAHLGQIDFTYAARQDPLHCHFDRRDPELSERQFPVPREMMRARQRLAVPQPPRDYLADAPVAARPRASSVRPPPRPMASGSAPRVRAGTATSTPSACSSRVASAATAAPMFVVKRINQCRAGRCVVLRWLREEWSNDWPMAAFLFACCRVWLVRNGLWLGSLCEAQLVPSLPQTATTGSLPPRSAHSSWCESSPCCIA